MKTTFFLLTLFFTATAYADQLDGYYISKAGDTVKGKIDVPIEAKTVNLKTTKAPAFEKLNFEIKFAKDGGKFKKIDREDIKSFSFVYNGKNYHFETWNVKANKQLYLIPATGDVAPDGIYFIYRSEEGALPIYSLYQKVQATDNRPYVFTGPPGTDTRTSGEKMTTRTDGIDNRPASEREKLKADFIFKHPTKGFIYISDIYPMTMKLADAIKYLELDEEFTKALTSKDNNLLEIVRKYNSWKAK